LLVAPAPVGLPVSFLEPVKIFIFPMVLPYPDPVSAIFVIVPLVIIIVFTVVISPRLVRSEGQWQSHRNNKRCSEQRSIQKSRESYSHGKARARFEPVCCRKRIPQNPKPIVRATQTLLVQ